MRPNGFCAEHVDLQLIANLLGFSIKVEQNLHMVGDETNWKQNQIQCVPK